MSRSCSVVSLNLVRLIGGIEASIEEASLAEPSQLANSATPFSERKSSVDLRVFSQTPDALNLTVALWNSTRVLVKRPSLRQSSAVRLATAFAGGLVVWLLAATAAHASPSAVRSGVCALDAGSKAAAASHGGRKYSFTAGRRASRYAWLTRRLVRGAVVPHIHGERARPLRENGPATIEGDRVVVGGSDAQPLPTVLNPLGVLVSPPSSRPADRSVSRRRPRGPPTYSIA
jgi:hypothetical protein